MLPAGVASLSADSCAGCHRSDHDDWKHSAHGQAWTDPLFQDSFKVEPAVWCVNCHAPLAEQAYVSRKDQPAIVDLAVTQSDTTISLRDEGINCAACHVRAGAVITARNDRLAESSKYHPVKYSSYLRSSQFCAGCHQFNFPYFDRENAVHLGPAPMQNTYSEWRKSSMSLLGIDCQDCHGSPNNHKVYGPHTPGWLESKVTMEARLDLADGGNQLVRVYLTLRGIPHSFPTGDLFRGFAIEILAGSEIIGSKTFGRKTGDVRDANAPDGIYKRFIQENVLRPGKINPMISEIVAIELVRQPTPGEILTCRIVYQFRNKEAENPARDPSLLRKVIAHAQVQGLRHQTPSL